MKYIICTLLALPTLVFAAFEDWDKTEQRLWKSYVALNVVDTFQTFNLIDKQKDPSYNIAIESNPILGNYPTKEAVVVLKLGINYMAFKVLDDNPRIRTAALSIMNGIYIKTVQNNHELGLRISFRI